MGNRKTKAAQACFVYGSLRPDDDSGQMWTKEACKGMTARRAIVKDVRLFKDTYAVAVLGKKGHKVVGYILTHQDKSVFESKLIDYDHIEGYNSKDPE